jgi:O-antigen ligase
MFVVVLLLSSMGAIDAVTRPSLEPHDPDAISTEVPLAIAIPVSAVYVCGALFAVMYWRRVLRAARAVWPLVCLAALAPLSIAWSHDPLLTVRRSAFLLGSTLLGIYLGERFSTEQLARLLVQAVCLMMVAVVILYFVAPAYVVDYVSPIGAWKGLSYSKNAFGGYMAITVVLLLLVRFRRLRWLRYLFLVTAVVLLLLSSSATSLLTCVLIVTAMPLRHQTRFSDKRRRVLYMIASGVVVIASYILWEKQELLFNTLGRDSTLTGRTQLWATVLPAILKHPFLGYGYGSFWNASNGEAQNIWLQVKWFPASSHNGYLELCLNFGLVGLVVVLCVLVVAFRMAYDYLRRHDGLIGLWPISYLTFFALHNLTESLLLTTRSLEYLLFAAITTSMALNRYHRYGQTVMRGIPIDRSSTVVTAHLYPKQQTPR